MPSCAQIGGVFEAHGTDGRGDCVPTDPRPQFHGSAGDDGNAVTEVTMIPPFPNGMVDDPELVAMATNKDCWKLPSAPP